MKILMENYNKIVGGNYRKVDGKLTMKLGKLF